jgi:hypothetical protein
VFARKPRQRERASRVPARSGDAIAAHEQLARHFEAETATRSSDESLHPDPPGNFRWERESTAVHDHRPLRASADAV